MNNDNNNNSNNLDVINLFDPAPAKQPLFSSNMGFGGVPFDLMLNSITEQHFPDVLQHLQSNESKKVIEMYANRPDIINKNGANGGYTALHWITMKNDASLIKYLISECKANVNAAANSGETPLLLSVRNGNLTIIDLLLNNGADINVRDSNDRGVVHWCAYSGQVILFHFFKKYYNISFNDTDSYQQNPLHIACACGHAQLAKYLIKSKEIDLYEQDFNGNTCLHMSCKSALPQLSWLIVKASSRRILHIKNKLYQTPLEMICEDRTSAHLKIIEWLKIESKNFSNSYSNMLMFASWLWHFMLPAYIYTIPLIINSFIFNENNSSYKGIIAYGSFILLYFAFTSQSHRIKHISGLENPFFVGFFINVFVHNYSSYYIFYFGEFEWSFLQLFVLFLTVFHSYTLFKMLRMDPGFTNKSCTKSDGSEYEIMDLVRAYANKKNNAQEDKERSATNLLLEDDDDRAKDHIFCDSCFIVITTPVKHCKLCEHCFLRFDHHCLFLNKCIGLYNHKMFLLLLLSSLVCIAIYLIKGFNYLKGYYYDLPTDVTSFMQLLFSSTKIIWLFILFVTNSIAFVMLSFLFSFQLKVTSHGFTSQFRPLNLNGMRLSFKERVRNMYILCCKPYKQLNDLYFTMDKRARIIRPDRKFGSNNHGHSHNGRSCDHGHGNHGHSH